MVELTCPWCEAQLGVKWEAEQQEQSCPECLTSWAYELAEEREMATAA